jgi:hypothetical protein
LNNFLGDYRTTIICIWMEINLLYMVIPSTRVFVLSIWTWFHASPTFLKEWNCPIAMLRLYWFLNCLPLLIEDKSLNLIGKTLMSWDHDQSTPLYGFDLKVKRLGYLSYRNCGWNTILEVKIKAWGYIDLMIICDA